ncbi:RecB family exonuclease [Thermodesulfobacteriota bacterium]
MYSHSKISAFEQCPLKYKFSYIDRIRRETEPIEFFLGSRAHDALEHLYKCKFTGRLLTEEETISDFESRWDRKWHEKIRINKAGFGPEHYREVARKCVAEYYRHYHPFDQATLIGTERRVVFSLDMEESHKFQGYIDRLDKAGDGAWEIHDYKTSGSLPTQDDADRDRQLALYEIGIRGMHRDIEEVTLVWHYLRFDTEVRSTRTTAQLDALRETMIGLIEEIETSTAAGDFPARESALCGWCEHQKICPLWSHKFPKEEEAEPGGDTAVDGAVIVDRLAEIRDEMKTLSARQKELKDEKTGLESDLMIYASDNKIERVFGTGHEATIKHRTDLKVPTKTRDPEEYERLEKLLRDSASWSDVSTLSYAKLKGLLSEGSGTAIPDEARAMVREEKSLSVSLRKRRDRPEV